MIKYKLKNGLTVLLTPQKETKAVTVFALVGVGPRYEKKSQAGIAHFLEHMMFKGTQKRPTTLALSKELDKVGAEYNAYTSSDNTGYHVKINSGHLELAIDFLADILNNSKIEEEEVNREKGTIIEEIHHRRQDNPREHVNALLGEIIFKGNDLGRDGIGTKETIKAISQQQIKNFRDQYYLPENTVLSVAGNINLKKVKSLIEKYFTTPTFISTKRKTDFVRFKSRQINAQINLKYKKTEQVHLALGFLGPSYESKNLIPAKLLSNILGGSMSSRLHINIRERQGLCYYILSGLDVYQDTGSLDIVGGFDKKRIFQAIELILKELKSLKTKGITSEELKKSKENIKGKMILNLEDSEAVAEWYGKQQLLISKTKTPEQRIAEIMKVTKNDVNQVAKKIFQTKKINLALIGPFKDKKEFLKILKI